MPSLVVTTKQQSNGRVQATPRFESIPLMRRLLQQLNVRRIHSYHSLSSPSGTAAKSGSPWAPSSDACVQAYTLPSSVAASSCPVDGAQQHAFIVLRGPLKVARVSPPRVSYARTALPLGKKTTPASASSAAWRPLWARLKALAYDTSMLRPDDVSYEGRQRALLSADHRWEWTAIKGHN